MQNPTRHTEETIDTEKKVHQKFHSDAHHSLCLAAKWNEDFVSLTKCTAQNIRYFFTENDKSIVDNDKLISSLKMFLMYHTIMV